MTKTQNMVAINDSIVEIVNDISGEDLAIIVNAVTDIKENDCIPSSFELIGTGTYSGVYGYKNYAIKILGLGRRKRDYTFNSNSDCNDIDVMKNLDALECIPKLYAIINSDVIIVERIDGYTIGELREGLEDGKSYDININWGIIDEFDNALLDVVFNGYSPDDLHEYNVMIDKSSNKLKFVDVGWFFKIDKDRYKDKDEVYNHCLAYSNAHRWTGGVLVSCLEILSKKVA